MMNGLSEYISMCVFLKETKQKLNEVIEQKTNKDIIETLDKVLEIHQNGRAKRVEAEKELLTIEKELKDKLLEIKVNK